MVVSQYDEVPVRQHLDRITALMRDLFDLPSHTDDAQEMEEGEEAWSIGESLSEPVDDILGLLCDQVVESWSKDDNYFTIVGVTKKWGILLDLLVASKRVAEPPELSRLRNHCWQSVMGMLKMTMW